MIHNINSGNNNNSNNNIDSSNNNKQPNKNNVLIEILAGSFSGALTRCIVAPLDVVKIRLQLQKTNGVNGTTNYKGVINTMSKVVREEGIRSLWKGNLSAELLWITYAAVQFSTYNRIVGMLDKEYHQSKLNQKNYKPSVSITMISGATAGIVSSVISYPFDIIRTNIVNNHGKTNFTQTYKSIIQRGGHKHLFSGISSSLIQIVPQMGFQFTFYESFKYLSYKYISNGSGGNNDAPLNQFMCGLFSGAISKFLVLPFDVVKKRLQVNHNAQYNMKHVFIDLYYNEGGIKSFFKGGVPSIIKAGLAAALTFTFFEQSKRILSS